MGAPEGNQNATHRGIWRQAIIRALDKRGVSRADALDALAEKLINLVETGDLPAIKEFGDRIDGKSLQAVEQKTEISGSMEVATRPTMTKEEWLKAHGVGTAAGAAS